MGVHACHVYSSTHPYTNRWEYTHRHSHVYPSTTRAPTHKYMCVHTCMYRYTCWLNICIYARTRSFIFVCVSTSDIFNPHRNWIGRFFPSFQICKSLTVDTCANRRILLQLPTTVGWLLTRRLVCLCIHTWEAPLHMPCAYLYFFIYIWSVHMCICIYVCQFLAHVCARTLQK